MCVSCGTRQFGSCAVYVIRPEGIRREGFRVHELQGFVEKGHDGGRARLPPSQGDRRSASAGGIQIEIEKPPADAELKLVLGSAGASPSLDACPFSIAQKVLHGVARRGRRKSAQGKLAKRAPPWGIGAATNFALKGQGNDFSPSSLCDKITSDRQLDV